MPGGMAQTSQRGLFGEPGDLLVRLIECAQAYPVWDPGTGGTALTTTPATWAGGLEWQIARQKRAIAPSRGVQAARPWAAIAALASKTSSSVRPSSPAGSRTGVRGRGKCL